MVLQINGKFLVKPSLNLESKSMKSIQCTKSMKFESKSQKSLLSKKFSNIHAFTALSVIKKNGSVFSIKEKLIENFE